MRVTTPEDNYDTHVDFGGYLDFGGYVDFGGYLDRSTAIFRWRVVYHRLLSALSRGALSRPAGRAEGPRAGGALP